MQHSSDLFFLRALFVLFAIAGLFVVGKAMANGEVDDKGCWKPDRQNACFGVEFARMDGDDSVIRYTNNCDLGVYVRFATLKKNGVLDDGAEHVGPGKSFTWRTSNSTGRYKYRYTGSAYSSSDWICRSRDPEMEW